jgi:hypothetical protein
MIDLVQGNPHSKQGILEINIPLPQANAYFGNTPFSKGVIACKPLAKKN